MIRPRNIFLGGRQKRAAKLTALYVLCLIFLLPAAAWAAELTVAGQRFRGNETLEDQRLDKLTRLKPGDVYSRQAVQAARARVVAAYRELGFFSTRVRVTVEQRAVAPEIRLLFRVEEGTRTRIARVRLNGEVPEELRAAVRAAAARYEGRVASQKNLRRVESALLYAMRREGYLQATARMQSGPAADGKFEVNAELRPSAPLSLLFAGNKLLTAAELVSPLHLETRRVPFTPNAIRSLCREIERLYQERGYIFARAEHSELEPAGARRRYQISISEGLQYRLREIEFQGREAFSAAELYALLKSRTAAWGLLARWRPGFVTTAQIAEDLAALETFYHRHGWRKARVDYDLIPDSAGGLRLVLKISEGKQSRIKQLELVWQNFEAALEGGDEAAIELALKVGDAWEQAMLEAERLRLETELSQRGHPLARVALEVDGKKRAARYLLEPGPEVRVRNLVFEGNKSTKARVLRRAVPLRAGDAWDKEKLRRAEQALYQLGIFQTVSVEAASGQLGHAPEEDVRVRVRERESGVLGAGVSLDTEDGLHLRGDLGQRNFLGRGEAFLLAFDGYLKDTNSTRPIDAGAARAGYTVPFFAGTSGTLLAEAFAQFDAKLIDEFSYDRFGSALTYQYPLSESLSGNFGLQVFQEDVFDVDAPLIVGPGDSGKMFYTFLRSELNYDRRDDVFNPRSGFLTSGGLRWSADALGSDANLFGAAARHVHYLPLGQAWVWINTAGLDAAVPYGDTEVVPLSQRLFLGGRNSLRGFSRNAVGPRAEDGAVVGGDLALNASTEVQYDFTDALSGVLFLDAGQVMFLEPGDFGGDEHELGDLRFSPGFGFRYKTPIGPLSVEYGFALDREFGEREGRLNIGIGTTF